MPFVTVIPAVAVVSAVGVGKSSVNWLSCCNSYGVNALFKFTLSINLHVITFRVLPLAEHTREVVPRVLGVR